MTWCRVRRVATFYMTFLLEQLVVTLKHSPNIPCNLDFSTLLFCSSFAYRAGLRDSADRQHDPLLFVHCSCSFAGLLHRRGSSLCAGQSSFLHCNDMSGAVSLYPSHHPSSAFQVMLPCRTTGCDGCFCSPSFIVMSGRQIIYYGAIVALLLFADTYLYIFRSDASHLFTARRFMAAHSGLPANFSSSNLFRIMLPLTSSSFSMYKLIDWVFVLYLALPLHLLLFAFR